MMSVEMRMMPNSRKSRSQGQWCVDQTRGPGTGNAIHNPLFFKEPGSRSCGSVIRMIPAFTKPVTSETTCEKYIDEPKEIIYCR